MLREVVPTFVPAIGEAGTPAVLPRAREPVVVAFRTGSDMREVCDVVSSSRDVLVEAAPGAGKTTKLPYELAAAMGCLVLHVLPSVRLADHVYQYAVAQGRKVRLMTDVADEFPVDGVVLTSASLLVAKWLAAGSVVLPECVLIHDESHECDAYTYLVKKLCITVSSVKCRVSATATSGASGFRPYEAKGTLVKGVFEGSATSWDPYDEGKPWSINSLHGNALLYVDSKTVAANLVETYASAGFASVRLHSRMSLQAFRDAMAAMVNPVGPVAVFVADSSYRSGFNFDLATIVDSGRVGYMDTSTGRPVRRERSLYEVERVQTSARGGRLGQATRYCSPAGLVPEAMICDLAPVEMEAVALVLRVLGYQVPRELETCVMASGMVPRDLCAALQREQPLALMRSEQLAELSIAATPAGRRSPFLSDGVVDSGEMPIDVADPRVSADTARKHGQQRLSLGDPPARSAWSETWQDDLQHLMRVDPGVRQMKVGRAYTARGLQTDQDSSIVFPEGADSVMRLAVDMDQGAGLLGLSVWHKSVAVNLLLSRQAALAAEMDGIRRALAYARGDQGPAGTPAARQLATRVAERLAVVSSSLGTVGDILMRLGKGFCSYHEIELNAALSDSVYQDWSQAWSALPRANSLSRLEAGFSVGREGAAAGRAVADGARRLLSDRQFVPMVGKGGAMRAIGSAITSVSSRSRSSSGSVLERCPGSVYWSTTFDRDKHGQMRTVRRLVCEYCGVGASKRAHGMG